MRKFFLQRGKWSKILWTPEAIQFIIDNYEKLTNPEIAEALGERLTGVRYKLAELGLKRMEMEYWTEEQVQFLKANFRFKGDIELAEIFEKTWPKQKKWTEKHIRKKRVYLKLDRYDHEVAEIRLRNTKLGRFAMCAKKRWQTTGQEPDGTIKIWKRSDGGPLPVIKINGTWKHWARYTYELHFGEIPKKMKVFFKNRDATDLRIDNLELLTGAEVVSRNATLLSDNYVSSILSKGDQDLKEMVKSHPELLELKRNQLKLNRIIKNERRNKAGSQRPNDSGNYRD